MTTTRRRIHEAVTDHPGLHFSELTRRLDIAPGQAQYHLRKLTATEAVVAAEIEGQTHYYPPEIDAWERRALAILRRETAGEIVASLLADDPLRPATITAELDIARSTLEYHLDRLVDAGIVEKRRRNGRVIVVAARPEATAELLYDADPSLAERLVDRYTRLLDRFLEG